MPSLADHQSKTVTKLLLIGDSGSGKTGALTSLVEAGYKLFILDYDNGLDSLVWQVRERASDKLQNVHFVSLADRLKSSPTGPILDGPARAFVDGLKLLDKWEDGSKPSEWGADCILVIDSLTFLSEAAFRWAQFMNPTAKDQRQIYGASQDAIENTIALLTGVSMKTNVIVIAHMKFIERPDGVMKAYPTAVGNALSPKIAAYFNSVIQVATKGSGTTLQRYLQLLSTPMIDLKNPLPGSKLPPTLDIKDGLATFFKSVRG